MKRKRKSGLIEVPAFNKPTVNIGQRQLGRLRASSVIDCGESEQEIDQAIRKALSFSFIATLAHTQSPYGQGNTSVKIKNVLKSVRLEKILVKPFHDLEDGATGGSQ